MNSLDRTLELFAASDLDVAAVAEAQRKLEATLAARISARQELIEYADGRFAILPP